MTSLDKDLNETITSAVNARVEAAVAAALLNDESFTKFVTAALHHPVKTDSYSRETKSYISHLLEKTIEAKTKEVVAEEIAGAAEQIRDEVRKALRKSIGVIADQLVDGFVENASGRHPSIKVEFSGNN